VLEYKLDGKRLTYKWGKSLDGFNIRGIVIEWKSQWLTPTTKINRLKLKSRKAAIGG
jgi:hypothetical protein